MNESDTWFINNLKLYIDTQVKLVESGKQEKIDREYIYKWVIQNLDK